MKVVATKPAFFNGSRVRPGAVVEVPTGYKGSWFVPADAPEAKAVKAPKAKQSPQALSELGGEDVKSFVDVHKGELA